MRPGDITYAMNGVAQTADDGSGWSTSMLLRNGGHPDAPKAFVAYPNATATIGNVEGPPSGIRTTPEGGGHPGYWVFAGFVLRGKGRPWLCRAVTAGVSWGTIFRAPRATVPQGALTPWNLLL